jgi:Fic family protein
MKSLKNYIVNQGQVEGLSKIERFQGAFEARSFQKPAFVQKLKKTSIITSSGASTRIEGAILADDQVKELVERGCQIDDMSSRSEREVVGYISALEYVYEHFQELDVSEKTVCELHQLLMGKLSEGQMPASQIGSYKTIKNDVVEKDSLTGEIIKVWFETTPPGSETKTAMHDLIADYHKIKESRDCHSLILTAGFIVHFLAIHPFRDGNGRLSRLLTTLLLLKSGYNWVQYTSHEKVIEDNKEAYYLALRDTQITFNNEPVYTKWMTFFLKVLCVQVDFLASQFSKESPESILNLNEKRVYHIIESEKECSVSYILENVDMTRNGLKDLLSRLVEKGYIKRKGKGRGTTYTIA